MVETSWLFFHSLFFSPRPRRHSNRGPTRPPSPRQTLRSPNSLFSPQAARKDLDLSLNGEFELRRGVARGATASQFSEETAAAEEPKRRRRRRRRQKLPDLRAALAPREPTLSRSRSASRRSKSSRPKRCRRSEKPCRRARSGAEARPPQRQRRRLRRRRRRRFPPGPWRFRHLQLSPARPSRPRFCSFKVRRLNRADFEGKRGEGRAERAGDASWREENEIPNFQSRFLFSLPLPNRDLVPLSISPRPSPAPAPSSPSPLFSLVLESTHIGLADAHEKQNKTLKHQNEQATPTPRSSPACRSPTAAALPPPPPRDAPPPRRQQRLPSSPAPSRSTSRASTSS